jgi:hypothetical protein
MHLGFNLYLGISDNNDHIECMLVDLFTCSVLIYQINLSPDICSAFWPDHIPSCCASSIKEVKRITSFRRTAAPP